MLVGVLLGTEAHARDYESLLLIRGAALAAICVYLLRGRLSAVSGQEYMLVSVRPAPVPVRTGQNVPGRRTEEA